MLLGLAVALWQWVAAPYADDFAYMRCVPGTSEDDFWIGSGAMLSSWGDIGRSSLNHYLLVNGRLANILVIISMGLPDWVSALLLGLSAIVAFAGIVVAAGMTAGRSLPSWLAALGGISFWLWLPWSDSMQSRAYIFNYLIPMAFSLVFAVAFLRDGKSRKATVIGSLCGFLAGWLHEGFGLALTASAAVVILADLCRRCMTTRRWILFGSLLAGTLLVVAAPSTLGRLGRHTVSLVNGFYMLAFNGGLRLTFVAALVLLVFSMRHRISLRMPDVLFWTLSTLTGGAMAMLLAVGQRTLWWCNTSLLILLLAWAASIAGRRERRVLVYTFLGLNLLFCCLLVGVQADLSRRQTAMLQQFQQTPEARIAISLPESDLPERIVLSIPRRFTTDIHSTLTMSILGMPDRGDGRLPLLVPETWGNDDFPSWPSVSRQPEIRGGNNIFYGPLPLPKGTTVTTADGAMQIESTGFCLTAAADTLYRYELRSISN